MLWRRGWRWGRRSCPVERYTFGLRYLRNRLVANTRPTGWLWRERELYSSPVTVITVFSPGRCAPSPLSKEKSHVFSTDRLVRRHRLDPEGRDPAPDRLLGR